MGKVEFSQTSGKAEKFVSQAKQVAIGAKEIFETGKDTLVTAISEYRENLRKHPAGTINASKEAVLHTVTRAGHWVVDQVPSIAHLAYETVQGPATEEAVICGIEAGEPIREIVIDGISMNVAAQVAPFTIATLREARAHREAGEICLNPNSNAAEVIHIADGLAKAVFIGTGWLISGGDPVIAVAIGFILPNLVSQTSLAKRVINTRILHPQPIANIASV